ncbi:MAG TPA: BamA/TamA family outer membrane protein [Puia sp.]|nr:BamA/TamA family outer membrane protein [Puia sp.]
MRIFIRILPLLLLFSGYGLSAHAQNDRVVRRMFLVGDAGALQDGHHPVCDWLKQHVDWNDTSNVLVYLGDNVYPQGMPPEGSKSLDAAKRILDYQVSVVSGKKANAYFIPGNHDWKQGKPGGWDQVKKEADYLESLGLANVQFLPKDGCPGPVAVPVGEKMVLVCMDSQWWLQQDDRPGPESDCDCKDPKSIINALKDIISTYPDKLIVLAMHHPFYTHGVHGGYYTLKQHIFPLTDFQRGLYIPLPVIGSIYPITRGVFGNVQDVHNPKYKELIRQVDEVIRGHQNVVHVAGHDHGLQLLQHDSLYYVVSGAGSKATRVKMGSHSLFAKQELGFAVIELRASGQSAIKFYTDETKDLEQPLYVAAVPPLLPKIDTAAIVGSFPDSVTATGYPGFLVGGFSRWLLGSNYRKEWAVPIRVKVFDMTGWTPLQRGGGNQTRSLRMRNAAGEEYVLRGVEKYVTDNALPVALQGAPLVKDLVTDGVSASYPYAALSIPPLATALHVPHANPRLVFVPDDPRLGKFRSDYGNLFALLEEREPGNGKKTYNFTDLDKKLFQDNDNTVDQKAVLRARLLDMFVMDFDRHEDQWRWEADDNGKGKTFSPVPRDRDQPFFINSGVIPWIAGSAWAAPQLQGFRVKARNIASFNFNARNFDHNFMNELTEKDWRDGVEGLLATMTDSLIEASLKLQPAAIYPYSMSSIIAKLKERRKYFLSDMMAYYHFLAGTVSVYGSDKKELFDVERKEGGSVVVTVYKVTKEGETGKKLFGRAFLSGETKEIRLYGLGGDDQFHTHGAGGGSIIVRIIGGPGNDDYKNEASSPAVKTKIYDLSTEKNTFTGDGGHLVFLSKDPSVNAVNRLGFKYNVLAPLLSAGYNPDDGVFLGAGFRYTVQGFHKDPYKQLHTLLVEHALSTKAFYFKYNFEAIHAIGSLDLLLHTSIKAPNNTINFFGFGNESVYDKHTKEGIRYYRARFNAYDADLQLRRKMGSVFTLAAGPAVQYFTLDSADNKDRFINRSDVPGLDHATLYHARGYVGGRATAIVDDRNDKILPTRGIYWETRFSSYGGLNEESHRYSQLNSDLSLFTSFNTRGNVVISTRVGWGKTFGKYEFYQSQYLGGTENLRGYRKFRFAGDESFYHNIDLRIRLADFQTYLFPGSLGLLFFNDVGRVWLRGEDSRQWHDGYGGGLWISPLKKLVFSASYAQGTDGGVTLLKLGFQY